MVCFGKVNVFLFVCIFLVSHLASASKRRKVTSLKSSRPKSSSRSTRAGRYLFPFAVVNFPPEPCSPSNTQHTDGVCLSKTRCIASGGETVGPCQQGLGSCCKFTKQCNSNRRSISVFETVENLMSSSVSGSCEFVFPKQPGICQVRLDFVNVNLQEAYLRGPNAGNCQTESLVVSGSANLNGPLKACGRLTGQHMILSYGASADLISLILHSELLSANYHIRATQIPCNSPYKAPDDCLQYFYSTSAAIKSFGFPRQLNNQRYTICVKPSSGGTFISWDKCQDMDAEGVIHRDRFNVSEPAIKCLTDWIAIDAEKRCGQEFLPMTTGLGSHSRIRVNFDENETGNDLFTVPVPADQLLNPQLFCEQIAISNPVYFQGGNNLKLCHHSTVDSQNVCLCKFSSTPDSNAQAFALNIPNTGVQPGLYICPKILGYTEKLDPSDNMCKYLANIRIADKDNTGFCIRYQAM